MTAASAASGNDLSFALLPLVVFALPFLDVPLLFGGAYVKPLALPVAVIVLGLALVLGRGPLRVPGGMPLRIVMLIAAWAVIGAVLMPRLITIPGEMKGQTLGLRIVRDMTSLLGGIVFFVCLSTAITHAGRATRAVRWVLMTFWVVLPFVLVQAAVVATGSDLALMLDRVMALVRSDLQGPGYRKAFGLAPEASMLADQLLSLYLPFAFALVLSGCSLFRTRLLGLRAEVGILLGGLLALLFSQSRIGLVTLLYLVAAAMLIPGFRRAGDFRRFAPRAAMLLGLVVLLGAAAIALAGDKATEILATFSSVDASIDDGVWSNVTRFGSIVAGLDMALAHPMGVGTGAFPFLFEQHVPDWALISPEIQAVLGSNIDYLLAATGSTGGDIETRLPDAKALPARVAAELGVPGLLLFGALWLVLVRRCWAAYRAVGADPVHTAVALGTLLSLLSMLPLSLSSNSYVWVHWIFVAAVAAAIGRPAAVNKERA